MAIEAFDNQPSGVRLSYPVPNFGVQLAPVGRHCFWVRTADQAEALHDGCSASVYLRFHRLGQIQRHSAGCATPWSFCRTVHDPCRSEASHSNSDADVGFLHDLLSLCIEEVRLIKVEDELDRLVVAKHGLDGGDLAAVSSGRARCEGKRPLKALVLMLVTDSARILILGFASAAIVCAFSRVRLRPDRNFAARLRWG